MRSGATRGLGPMTPLSKQKHTRWTPSNTSHTDSPSRPNQLLPAAQRIANVCAAHIHRPPALIDAFDQDPAACRHSTQDNPRQSRSITPHHTSCHNAITLPSASHVKPSHACLPANALPLVSAPLPPLPLSLSEPQGGTLQAQHTMSTCSAVRCGPLP